ncbi:MAG: aminoacyl-tRNA hydrolase [Anaerolineaceae bacterium]|nr:aminoacyl-tRNA hydrolase [Anaerolineaceae bacterium]
MFKKEFAPDSKTYLIVGLGNPGREYRNTRHNIGFMAVDRFCETHNVRLGKVKFKAIIGQARIGSARVIFAKPQTFMNRSGDSVAAIVRFYKIPIDQLLVVHDDLDLPYGSLRLRPGGGAGGQKGLGSIIERLGTQRFPRMRIGIGRPPGQMDAASYVLQNFGRADQEELDFILRRAEDAMQIFIKDGLEKAMNQFNGTGGNGA